MNSYRMEPLSEEQWNRIAALRLESLRESPDWLAGEIRDEEMRGEEEWRKVARESFWSAITFEGKDIAIMAVSPAEPIRNSDTWLHSCWISPQHRGQNLTAMMIERLDQICRAHGWSTQGLGVWPDNQRAISSYQRHGFVIAGEPRPSRRRPTQMYIPMFRALDGSTSSNSKPEISQNSSDTCC